MRKAIVIIVIILSMTFFLTSCTNVYSVNTDSVSQLKSDVKNIDKSINDITVHFSRPGLSIGIVINGEPSNELKEAVLNRVKQFATLKNLDEISKKYGWNDHVSEVDLSICPFGSSHFYMYIARYFKSYDQTDTSINNIDNYQTWSNSIVDLSTEESK